MIPATDDILARLPHDHPFRFVTRLLELEPGTAGRGVWQVRGDEDFLRGHFPDQPIVPGVLIGEALAQCSGLVIAAGGNISTPAVLAHVDLRFKSLVTPPAMIELHSRVERSLGSLHQFQVEAILSGVRVAQGKITLATHCDDHV